MERPTDNMMVGGDALSAVLEKTKATIDSVNRRVTATEQKANTALHPDATVTFEGHTYTVSQLLQAVAKLMEKTIVVND